MIQQRNLDKTTVDWINSQAMGLEARGALGGTIYYVENNSGNDKRDGLSWDNAFKTLSKAISVCHKDMGRRARFARRNTIYICGDAIEEDIVLLPEKTDIVGIGQCDGYFGARLKGNHVPATRSTSGVRFYNVTFHAATGVIWTLTNNQPGIEFHRCTFLAGASTTIAILLTAVGTCKISNCDFMGYWDSQFSTAAIDIAIGHANGQVIEYCNIENNPIGIRVIINKTGGACFIRHCNIKTTAQTIDDNSGTFWVIGNNLISAAATGAGSIDVAALHAVGNWYQDASKAGNYPVTA